ncbi:MAG: hypothetical protein KJ956_14815, partial [Actinobacteria bacterium]|nr:hypothetical protein [Actinomycetota bacterium]
MTKAVRNGDMAAAMNQLKKAALVVLACHLGAAAAACGAKMPEPGEPGMRGVCGNAPPGRQHVGVIVSGIDATFEQFPVTAAPGSFGVIIEEKDGYHRFYFHDPESTSRVEVVAGTQEVPSAKRTFFNVTLATVESMKKLAIHDPCALVRFD